MILEIKHPFIEETSEGGSVAYIDYITEITTLKDGVIGYRIDGDDVEADYRTPKYSYEWKLRTSNGTLLSEGAFNGD